MAIKTIKIKRPAGGVSTAGGATIASRLQLNTEPVPTVAEYGGKSTTCAVIAAVLALIVAGVLTYIIWKHWEFLMPA